MSYFKKKVFIIIFLLIVSLVGISISNFNLGAYEIPSGYGKVKFGMLKEEIEKIIQGEGKSIEYVGGDLIAGDMLFDEAVGIRYSLTPITKKCYGIDIIIPNSVDCNRIERTLIEKYGEPTSSYRSPYLLTIWKWENVLMMLTDGKILNFPNTIIIGYLDKNLKAIMIEEQKKLDKESKDRL